MAKLLYNKSSLVKEGRASRDGHMTIIIMAKKGEKSAIFEHYCEISRVDEFVEG